MRLVLSASMHAAPCTHACTHGGFSPAHAPHTQLCARTRPGVGAQCTQVGVHEGWCSVHAHTWTSSLVHAHACGSASGCMCTRVHTQDVQLAACTHTWLCSWLHAHTQHLQLAAHTCSCTPGPLCWLHTHTYTHTHTHTALQLAAHTHTHTHTHARFPLLGKWPICLELTTSRSRQERSWDTSPEGCGAAIVFMERISFQRSSEVHGPEAPWL